MPKDFQTAAEKVEAKARGAARVVLHRFHDCAALSVLNAPGTVYLDAKAARAMARDMARLARSIEKEKFGESSFSSEGFPAFESSFHIPARSGVKRGAKE